MEAADKIRAASGSVVANAFILTFLLTLFVTPVERLAGDGCNDCNGFPEPVNLSVFVDEPTLIGTLDPSGESEGDGEKSCGPTIETDNSPYIIAAPTGLSYMPKSAAFVCVLIGLSGGVERAYYPQHIATWSDDAALLEKVRRDWRFAPAMRFGHPVATWQRIRIERR